MKNHFFIIILISIIFIGLGFFLGLKFNEYSGEKNVVLDVNNNSNYSQDQLEKNDVVELEDDYSYNSEEIKDDLLGYRFHGNNNKRFFLFLCNNEEYIEKYYVEKFKDDTEFHNFLGLGKKCIQSVLDGYLDKSLLLDGPRRDFLYKECSVSKEEIEGNGHFGGNFEPIILIMGGYYSGKIDGKFAKNYLKKFSLLSYEDFKYYNDFENKYATLFLDVLNNKKNSEGSCQNYLNSEGF